MLLLQKVSHVLDAYFELHNWTVGITGAWATLTRFTVSLMWLLYIYDTHCTHWTWIQECGIALLQARYQLLCAQSSSSRKLKSHFMQIIMSSKRRFLFSSLDYYCVLSSWITLAFFLYYIKIVLPYLLYSINSHFYLQQKTQFFFCKLLQIVVKNLWC